MSQNLEDLAGNPLTTIDNAIIERSMSALEPNLHALVDVLGRGHIFNAMGKLEYIKRNPSLVKNDGGIDARCSLDLTYAGRSGASITYGRIDFGQTDESLQIPVRYYTNNKVTKVNTSSKLDLLEYHIMKTLSKDHSANIASVDYDSSKLLIEQLKEPSLFELAYFDWGKANKEELKPIFKKLIEDFTHISIKLTYSNIINPELQQIALANKYKSIVEGIGVPLVEARNNFHTYKLIHSLNITSKGFLESFSPIQQFMNQYAKDNSFWIWDPSPKNMKEKLFDFNKIDEAVLNTGLTLAIDMVPNYFSMDERMGFLAYAVEVWNKKAAKKMEFDSEFKKSYYCESFYRAVLNASHCLNESKETRKAYAVSPFYFMYAKLIDDADKYMDIAKNALSCLVEENIVSHDKADALKTCIANSLDAKMGFIPKEDFQIDLGIYDILRPDYHSFLQKAVQADTNSFHSLKEQYAVTDGR